MIRVIFYNLLRSKYNIKETMVEPGTINQIINQIIEKHPNMKHKEFETAVVFLNGTPIHRNGFDRVIDDNEELIITHFVGGG